MAWTEAPVSGESRRSTALPHAFCHRVSSRLYLCRRSERRRFIPFAEVGEIARLCVHHVRCWWSLPLRRNIGMSQWANTAITRVITISRSEFS
jgi:hypothetical protein